MSTRNSEVKTMQPRLGERCVLKTGVCHLRWKGNVKKKCIEAIEFGKSGWHLVGGTKEQLKEVLRKRRDNEGGHGKRYKI